MIDDFDHRNTLDQDNIRDFLDLMLVEQQNSKDPNSCFNGELGTYTIINSMIDMFIAGVNFINILRTNFLYECRFSTYM